jgi:hypothetical protein
VSVTKWDLERRQGHCLVCGSTGHSRNRHEASQNLAVVKMQAEVASFPWLAFPIGPWRPDWKDEKRGAGIILGPTKHDDCDCSGCRPWTT